MTLENGHAVVSMEIDNKYAPLIHDERLDAAPAEDGPQRHGGRGRPGHPVGARRSRRARRPAGLNRSRRSTRTRSSPRSTPTPSNSSSCCWRTAAGGTRSGAGPRREAVERPAPPRPARPRHRQDQRRARHAAPEHRAARSTTSSSSSTELGNRDQDLANFVDSSNAVLGSFAKEQASIRSAVQELPATLQRGEGRPDQRQRLRARSRGPALKKLIPRRQGDGPGAAQRCGRSSSETAGPIQNQIRPFTQQVASPVTHLAQIGAGLGTRNPRAEGRLHRAQLGLNALAYNPPGRTGGLPLLRPLAQPRPELDLPAPGRVRPDPPRPRAGELRATAQTAEQTLLAEPYLRLLYQLTGQPTRGQASQGCS